MTLAEKQVVADGYDAHKVAHKVPGMVPGDGVIKQRTPALPSWCGRSTACRKVAAGDSQADNPAAAGPQLRI